MSRRFRTVAWPILVALAAAACGAHASPDSPDSPDGTAVAASGRTCIPLTEFEGGGVENAPVLERKFPWFQLDPVVLEGFPYEGIVSGGPPPDGIRPIDEPCFDEVAAVDWLQPQSPVMVVEVGDDRRAYPLAIMTQHEIVNDVIGGVPVVVTYCPLCNSGLAFERTVDGQVLDFGTSGHLFQSNLVMYDRQTKSLWTQFTGKAVVGEDHVGTELVRLPTSLLNFEEFTEAAPDGHVLSRESMPGRDYGRNPYPGYEGSGDTFLFDGPRDDQLPPNTRVVGLGTDVDPIAIALPLLQQDRVVDVELDGETVTVWWAPGQASALDAASIDEGVDVGSTGVFRPVLDDGTALTFVVDPSDPTRFQDRESGSTWNLLGEAVEGPRAGERLEPIARDDTFWFVWFAFQPQSQVVGASAVS